MMNPALRTLFYINFTINYIYFQENDGKEIPEDIKKEHDDHWSNIVKAYETLTDETSYNNWLEYGNPDGQLVTKVALNLVWLN